jgi:hypothetical protein
MYYMVVSVYLHILADIQQAKAALLPMGYEVWIKGDHIQSIYCPQEKVSALTGIFLFTRQIVPIPGPILIIY